MAEIFGTAEADELFGSGAADEIYGLEGDDVLAGGEGDDSLDGGDGDDLLYGEQGDDLIEGGAGYDTVMLGGWATEFTVKRGPGGSLIVADRSGYWGSDVLTGVEHLSFGSYEVALADLAAEGTSGDDLVEGGAGIDWLFGNAGNDVLRAGAGTNLIDGGAGEDTAIYAGASGDYRIFVNPEGLIQVDRIAGDDEDVQILGSDVLIGVEHLHFEGDDVTVDPGDVPALGTSGADALVGTPRHDLLLGEGGDDSLDGGSGDDVLIGGEGDDVFQMGEGDDLAFDFGYSLVSGDDTYVYDPGDGNDRIADEGGFDVVEFGAEIDPSEVLVALDEWGTSYVLTFTDRAGSLVLTGSASGNPALEIEEIRFADDTIWTAADLAAVVAPPEPPLAPGGEFLP